MQIFYVQHEAFLYNGRFLIRVAMQRCAPLEWTILRFGLNPGPEPIMTFQGVQVKLWVLGGGVRNQTLAGPRTGAAGLTVFN
jgi:hypothetical protein